jgi:predicted ATPase
LKDIKNRPFAPFIAGTADRASEFTMPRSLFGRQYQLNQLSNFHLESQERQQSGVVFVKGYPGVGKTALVKEWAGRMRSDPSVIFAQGKYQQTGTVAFSAIIQAFRELTRQILTEPALSIEHWGTAIQNAVKGDISSLTLLLPDVAHIFPKHSSAKPLYGQSSQRTEPNRLLAQFLRVFTERKKVILFLDDMQWCSSVDVQFIASFIRELNGSSSILFVCAYRDNLVGMDHHIRTELEDRIPSETIDLNSLTEEDVERVLSSTLRMPWEECEDLAKLIYARTWGNPAFMETVRSFLLHD